MTHKPPLDRDQADLFGIALQPVAAKVRAVRRARAVPVPVIPAQPEPPAFSGPATPGKLAVPIGPPEAEQPPADPSPADLAALVIQASDEALAAVAVAAVRQLRRRLARGSGGGGGGRKPSSALHRAAAQIAAELGGSGDGDDL